MMDQQHRWDVDDEDERAGKLQIVKKDEANGFNSQRDNGSPLMLLLAILAPIIGFIIYAMIIGIW